jgi:MoaA/NifB/PqqE/SkfB family radical SAM enzyme
MQREIWIWGAKTAGIAAFFAAKRLYKKKPTGIIDNNPYRQGQTIDGVTIISCNEFLEKINHEVFVIISSNRHHFAIESYCEKIGLRRGIDFCLASEILGPVYEIDITNNCNLKCPSCPRGNYHIKLKNKVMHIDYFEKIADKILHETPHASYVTLFCWADSFLAKNIEGYIEILKKRQIPCFLSTSLNTRIYLDNIIKAHPEYIRISTSGYYQNVYEINHTGGNINLVKSNMYQLRYLLDKYSKNTYIEVAYHKYKYNCGEDLSEMKRLCLELQYSLEDYYVTLMPVEYAINVIEGNAPEHIYDVMEMFCIDIRNFPKIDMTSTPGLCLSYDNVVCITPEGSVLVCDYVFDPTKSIIAENCMDIDFRNIANLKITNEVCQKCLKYGLPSIYKSVHSIHL